MADSFAHLHVHTEYSMLDGAARIDEVVAAAAADGQPAIGITDHGNMYGVLDFYSAARKAGITPVIGTEAYMAGESRFERPVRRGRVDDTGGEIGEGQKLYYHLTLLAESNQGYKNLMKLSSEAYLEGYFYKPRCLVPGQEIVTATGATAIEDVEVGDLVLTHRGRLRRVTQTMSRPFAGKLYGVRLNNRYGRVTWMTGEHPVLVRDQHGGKRWVEVQQIEAGRSSKADQFSSWRSFACLPKLRAEAPIERISTADHVDGGWRPIAVDRWVKSSNRSRRGPTNHYSNLLHEITLDYDFGFLLGLYAAEGHVDRGTRVTISLHQDETYLIDAVARSVKFLTGKEVVVDHRPGRPGYRGVSVIAYSAPLARLLAALCGTGARNKRLPAFTFEANDEFQQGALDGVLAGDGAAHPGVTIFAQSSRNLAWQVRVLAATLTDSFCSIAERWDGNPDHAVLYCSNVSTGGTSAHRRTCADDEYVYRPIAEILERDWEGTVYNIEVEDDHSYVSDFAIHNCDWELLERHHEGVIATTGCLGGVVNQALLRDDVPLATKLAARLSDIFGPGGLYVEIQDHGMADQHRTNRHLIEIARELHLPLLATNDSHYVHRADAVAHDALLCVQTGAQVDDPKRFKFEGDEHYLKTAAEMRALFAEVPDACDSTLEIAERANVEIEFGKVELPDFPLPAPFTSDDEYLGHLTFEGAKQRYGHPVPGDVAERLTRELGVIAEMGFSSYFLIVWDLIRHARDRGIRVGPGRGSAAGSCAAYCLRITDLDPLEYGLLFEAFLNTGRREMPDIDMDFDERYRAEMIRYAAEKYGSDHVAQIVTFSTIKARAAVRDGSRVLGYPYAVGDRIAKLMPPLIMGRDTPLAACLELTPGYEEGYKMAAELRGLYETDPEAKKVVDVARGLEGLRRQDGIHAAAVVITREQLTEYLPVQRKPGPDGDITTAPIVTQYEMHGVAKLGLLKMDFLGLRNLSVIEKALDLIEATTGTRLDIDAIPLDDDKTFEMLRRGDSVGVFQLEGGPMRALMRSLAPTCFEDIGALVALYRPGPMAANMHNDFADRKNGRKPITGPHPEFSEVLADTYGLMIYQEGLLRIAERFAGYSAYEGDVLRKACGKKIRALMATEREKFVAACERNGYGAELGSTIFDIIEPFADYAFRKSHAFCYGKVAYQTAWLKANHPVEYLAALLTSVKDDKDKTAVYLAECRSMGIDVLVPDINKSMSDFVAVDGKVPFGLSAIRNVGGGLVGLIVAERDEHGPFTDFYDFCQRVSPAVLNKRSVESLIKAGAFDSLGHPRRGLLMVFEQVIDRTLARRRERDMGIMSLFGELEEGPGSVHDERSPIPDLEFDQAERLSHEKEMLGLYVSSHPLLGVESALRRHTDCTINELRELRDGEMRWVGGVVTSLQRKYTKRGDLMATFILEDLQSAIEVFVFPRTMLDYGVLLADDAVVCVKGRIDLREEPAKIVCMELKRPDLSPEATRPLRLKLDPAVLTATGLARLKEVLRGHPGSQPVLVHLDSTILRLPDEFRVDAGNGLFAELRELLGTNGLVG